MLSCRILYQFIVIISTTVCISNALGLNLFKKYGNLKTSSSTKYKYRTQYFDVPVDHFNFANNDTFKLRYLVNDDYWVPESGAPIFFYTGNEGDITLFAENTGFLWETAPEFKALIIFAEHRYYGESMPYGNKSFSDIRYTGYLTAEQALADYVDLITFLRSHQSDRPQSRRSPVIAFGGSYGGMLAAWIRMKYPAAVTGSLAASAPIWQFSGLTDCSAFYRIATSAYKISNHNCPDNIRRTWKEINDIAKTVEGRSWLTSNWTLCTPLKVEEDKESLKGWLNEIIINVAMANYPYPANFLGELPGHPVKAFCKHVSSENLQGKALLGAISNGLQVWLNYTGNSKCFNWSGPGDPPSLGYDGWNFQACTQMVMPMCSDGVNDMFEKMTWNLTEYDLQCKYSYKVNPRPYFIEKQYGGKHIKTASNIIFSNGLLDPWSGGGVMRNVSRSTVVVLIKEGAHHLDLRESNDLDPRSVIVARKYYKQLFRKWILKFRDNESEDIE